MTIILGMKKITILVDNMPLKITFWTFYSQDKQILLLLQVDYDISPLSIVNFSKFSLKLMLKNLKI
jgi:hypothetical protein